MGSILVKHTIRLRSWQGNLIHTLSTTVYTCVFYFMRDYKIRYIYIINYNILKNLYFFTQTTNIC